MTQKTLNLVRNTIFTATAALAAVIITLPSNAADVAAANKMGEFSGLLQTADFNPEFAQKDASGNRYRLNPAFKVHEELQPRTIFSVSFDQKNFLPLAAGLSNGLKERRDISFDRDRSLIADFKLKSNP